VKVAIILRRSMRLNRRAKGSKRRKMKKRMMTMRTIVKSTSLTITLRH
jgi:hypothetical protein